MKSHVFVKVVCSLLVERCLLTPLIARQCSRPPIIAHVLALDNALGEDEGRRQHGKKCIRGLKSTMKSNTDQLRIAVECCQGEDGD